MNSTVETRGLGRRGFLRMAAAVTAAAAVPFKAWAAMARPEAGFAATGLEDTLAALGGSAIESADIVLETPDIAENGAVVPASVTSNIPGTTKMYLLVEKNPNPLCAAFEIPEGTEAHFQTRVKVSQTCFVYGVAEANGKLYMAKKETKVTLGGCGG